MSRRAPSCALDRELDEGCLFCGGSSLFSACHVGALHRPPFVAVFVARGGAHERTIISGEPLPTDFRPAVEEIRREMRRARAYDHQWRTVAHRFSPCSRGDSPRDAAREDVRLDGAGSSCSSVSSSSLSSAPLSACFLSELRGGRRFFI